MPTKKNDSVRKFEKATDAMHRCYATIETQIYTAEVKCKEAGGDDFRCPLGNECPFRGDGDCRLNKLRSLVPHPSNGVHIQPQQIQHSDLE